MSEENIDAVLRGYEAFNRGDLDAAAEGFHPRDRDGVARAFCRRKRRVYRGIEGVRRFWGGVAG